MRRMTGMNDRLRLARKKAGFDSASQAAKRFGWAVSTYIAHENGQNLYDADAAEIYAKAFNVGAEWLLLGIDRGNDPLASARDELASFPPEVSKQIIEDLNRTIATVKMAMKIK